MLQSYPKSKGVLTPWKAGAKGIFKNPGGIWFIFGVVKERVVGVEG